MPRFTLPHRQQEPVVSGLMEFYKQRQNPLLDQEISTYPSLEDSFFKRQQAKRLMTQALQLNQTGLTEQSGKFGVGKLSKPTGANGRLNPNQLVSIGGGHKLAPAAARSWLQMKQAAARDGVQITEGDSYRPIESQIRLAKQKGLYSKGGLAATPGKSNHGWGTAVDVKNGRQWLARNAKRFGWHTIPREPWHWEYRGG